MTNELFLSSADESIRFKRGLNGSLILQSNDYSDDQFIIQTLPAEQVDQLRDFLAEKRTDESRECDD